MDFENDERFTGIRPLESRIWLASPTMHGDERRFIDEAFDTNWVTTAGSNIVAIEEAVAEYVGCKYAVALASGTSALHLATKLAGETLYGQAAPDAGTLADKKVFCTDVTFDASVNPVAYEDGEAIFIDSEYETWNMDPEALKKAFEIYPDVKLIVIAHLYGTPAKMEEIRKIADEHGALIVEDAAESLGAKYRIGDIWYETGALGKFNAISFNGNKIITGSSGGMFLTDCQTDADKVRKWSTQSREAAPWYQHKEVGYNYRMSNVVAGVVRGQLLYLQDHIDRKREIYERYKEGFRNLPVQMNPYDEEKSVPNFWLSCMVIDHEAMSDQVRGDLDYMYKREPGKTCPHEILDALNYFGAEGRPIWKPMHMQPIYASHKFISASAENHALSNDLETNKFGGNSDVGEDIFRRGVCLPSDIKMTDGEQDVVIEVVKRCFA